MWDRLGHGWASVGRAGEREPPPAGLCLQALVYSWNIPTNTPGDQILGYSSLGLRPCYCCDMATSSPKRRSWTIRSSRDLGRTLGDVRKLRDLTQQQLAEMTGMRRDYLSQLESSSDTVELRRLILAFRRLGADITVTVEAPDDAS